MHFATKILAIALCLVAIIIGLHIAFRYLVDPASLGNHSLDTTPLAITLSQTRLSIAQNVIRHKKDRKAGTTDHLDLYFLWPGLEGYNKDNADIFHSADRQNELIFVSLVHETAPSSMERRLDGIYRRFFIRKPWRGPDGLIGQALDPASGYPAEDIFYTRDHDTIFLTRCLQEAEAARKQIRASCLYDFALDKNLTAIVRFDRSLLDQWHPISSSIKRRLVAMRSQ